MENFQSILMAECVQRERQERAERNAEVRRAMQADLPDTTPRETVAGALIALARWVAPQHTALRVSTN